MGNWGGRFIRECDVDEAGEVWGEEWERERERGDEGTGPIRAERTDEGKVKGVPIRHGQDAQGADLPRAEYAVRCSPCLAPASTVPLPNPLLNLTNFILRIVQGNNQALGSPVNRIKITGFWASRSLTSSPSLSISQRLAEYYHYLAFRTIMFSIDVAFWASKVKGWVRGLLGLRVTGSWEDELERSMRGFAKSAFGVDVQPGAFEG